MWLARTTPVLAGSLARTTPVLAGSLFARCVLASFVLASWGCASTDTKKVATLQQRIKLLAQRNAAQEKQLEHLSNRLFLLEDKVDTSRVAMQRRQKPVHLPVIRIRPESSPSATADVAEAPRPAPQRTATGTTPQRTATGSTPQRTATRPTLSGVKRFGPVVHQPPRQAGYGRTYRAGRRVLSANGYGGKSIVSKSDVEYFGDAARSGPRPTLKLHQDSSSENGNNSNRSGGGSARAPSVAAGINPNSVKEKIPVVPIVKAKRANRLARLTEAMRAYTAALGKYRSGELPLAVAAFKRFIVRYAKHAYADNALYWLGESFYDLKNYRLALKMFRRVVDEYPNGNKAPAALLKMGFSYLKLDETKNARTVLAQVMRIFPDSGVAKLAAKTLGGMR
jgi:tol-pal system protein YbgF